MLNPRWGGSQESPRPPGTKWPLTFAFGGVMATSGHLSGAHGSFLAHGVGRTVSYRRTLDGGAGQGPHGFPDGARVIVDVH